jgi:hypothetical protein
MAMEGREGGREGGRGREEGREGGRKGGREGVLFLGGGEETIHFVLEGIVEKSGRRVGTLAEGARVPEEREREGGREGGREGVI